MIDRIQGFEGAGFGTQTEQLRDRAIELAAAARERLAQGSESVREYTVKQPARAIGIALGMGVLLGWLIKRR